MRVIAAAGQFCRPEAGEQVHWAEQLRVPDLSVGTYSILAGGIDGQSPHTEDEIYVVTAGRAVLESGGERVPVVPGMVIYVPAGEVHRFTDVSDDLALLVIFAPAEESRAQPSTG
ncbi:MAG TPA: cupin domain-containing protein [Streptosporangiaceae bacterium]|nr:cupin domain-containing protein [Streptosporangiaceae bacterium]